MKKLLFVSLCMMAFGYSRAQSLQPFVVCSQGDYFSSAGGSVSWTLGEIMGETYSTTGNILTQGFQQPLSFTTGIAPVQTGSVTVSVYPNPFSSYLTVSSAATKGQLQIFNMLGEQVSNFTILKGNTDVPLMTLSNGMYLAVFTNTDNQTVHSFKITKSE